LSNNGGKREKGKYDCGHPANRHRQMNDLAEQLRNRRRNLPGSLFTNRNCDGIVRACRPARSGTAK
jgi:hypothetical protein